MLKSLVAKLTVLTDLASRVVAETGRPNFIAVLDLVYCRLRFGTTADDYMSLKFYEKKDNIRKTFFTGHASQRLIKKYNNINYIPYFQNKVLFAKKFEEFFGRSWISLDGLDEEGLSNFIADKDHIICKPTTSLQARGIEKIEVDMYADSEAMLKYLKGRYGNEGILEEWIVQHEQVAQIYDKAVNCIRITTILEGGKCNFLDSRFTFGHKNNVANASAGGMVAPIELESGVVHLPAQDGTGSIYEFHPITGNPILGFSVPFWDETIKMIGKAARLVPEVGYVGWDVAITPTGPIIIEGNHNPGTAFQQLPAHLQDGTGTRKLYEQFL